jgi:hypothetical protein
MSNKEISDLQKKFLHIKYIPTNIGKEQLLLTLFDREKYRIYLPKLKAIEMGAIVKRKHTVVQSIKEAFMTFLHNY